MLKGLRGACCYLDDILVTGKDGEEHFLNLEAVLKRLLERGVRVKKKCSFFQQVLRYLGHRITTQGISATTEKLGAHLKAPAPKDRQQLQLFVGVGNFYGKFLPNLAMVAQPCFMLLRKNAPWCRDKRCLEALTKI
ncbi:hypothetical protein MRX96_009339 [Rhipicephalus microplus]